MDEQVFNKDGKVYKYNKLDDILKLNISDSIKEEFNTKFNRKVFFDNNGNCQVGKLIGIEVNEKLSELYYIVSAEDKNIYISCNNSLTLL